MKCDEAIRLFRNHKKMADYIKRNMNIQKVDIPERNEKVSIFIVRIPYVIKAEIIILDHEKIKKRKLKVYDEEGIIEHENPIARKFKYGMKGSISKYFNVIVKSKISQKEKKRFIFECICMVGKNILNGYMKEDILGFCNKEKECDGHKCGTKIYIIDDFFKYGIKWDKDANMGSTIIINK